MFFTWWVFSLREKDKSRETWRSKSKEWVNSVISDCGCQLGNQSDTLQDFEPKYSDIVGKKIEIGMSGRESIDLAFS